MREFCWLVPSVRRPPLRRYTPTKNPRIVLPNIKICWPLVTLMLLINWTLVTVEGYSFEFCEECLLVWGLSSHARIFHSFSVTLKGCTFWHISAFMAIEQWRFFCLLHLMWHGTSLYDGHLRVPVTVTTCFDDFGLQWRRFDLTVR